MLKNHKLRLRPPVTHSCLGDILKLEISAERKRISHIYSRLLKNSTPRPSSEPKPRAAR